MHMASSALSPTLTPSRADVRSRLRIRATISDFVANTRAIDVTRRLALAMRRRVDAVGSEDFCGHIRPLKFNFDMPDRMERRRCRRHKEKVNRGSEKRILGGLVEVASSRDGSFFSSTDEKEITGFSGPDAGVETVTSLRSRGATVVVALLMSGKNTRFSMATTSLSMSSRNGKKASTTESRMP